MVIFITGISSGFGLETARLLSQEGHVVYGTVRREVTPLPQVKYLRLDVRDAKAVQQAVEQIIEVEGRIDVLINNAGMGIGGPLEFATEEEIREQMDANFMGLVHCVDAVLPYMRKQGSGKIIALSSIGGLMGLPFQGFYSASKFAIEGYCEALRLETKPFGWQSTFQKHRQPLLKRCHHITVSWILFSYDPADSTSQHVRLQSATLVMLHLVDGFLIGRISLLRFAACRFLSAACETRREVARADYGYGDAKRFCFQT